MDREAWRAAIHGVAERRTRLSYWAELKLVEDCFHASLLSILEYVPCALEKNVYSTFFGYNVLKVQIKSNCSVVSCMISVALFSIQNSYPLIWVGCQCLWLLLNFLSISPFMSFTIYFMYFRSHKLSAYMLMSVIPSFCIDPFVITYCCLPLAFVFKVYFVWCKFCNPHFVIFDCFPSHSVYIYPLP